MPLVIGRFRHDDKIFQWQQFAKRAPRLELLAQMTKQHLNQENHNAPKHPAAPLTQNSVQHFQPSSLMNKHNHSFSVNNNNNNNNNNGNNNTNTYSSSKDVRLSNIPGGRLLCFVRFVRLFEL